MDKEQFWNIGQYYQDRDPLYDLQKDIIEPPCKQCKNFKPHRIYDCFGKCQGVKCCLAQKMYSDFSCFEI